MALSLTMKIQKSESYIMDHFFSFINELNLKQILSIVIGFSVFFGGSYIVGNVLRLDEKNKKSVIIQLFLTLICIVIVVIGFS